MCAGVDSAFAVKGWWCNIINAEAMRGDGSRVVDVECVNADMAEAMAVRRE